MNRLKQAFVSIVLAVLISACAVPAATDKAPIAAGSEANASSAQATPILKAAEPQTAKSESNTAALATSAVTAKAEQLLSEGTELYNKGDFKSAIRKLEGAKDASPKGSGTEQSALKYLAFSYCVTGQKIACKALFASLLQIAPTYQLSRAEAGHPIWGPVFKEAKASVVAASSSAATASTRN